MAHYDTARPHRGSTSSYPARVGTGRDATARQRLERVDVLGGLVHKYWTSTDRSPLSPRRLNSGYSGQLSGFGWSVRIVSFQQYGMSVVRERGLKIETSGLYAAPVLVTPSLRPRAWLNRRGLSS